jgi:hypothetical protein
VIKQVLAMWFVALAAAGRATEHRTQVVVAGDACTRYGFTASTADYVRCHDQLAVRRRAGRMAIGYDSARTSADAQAACGSYGVPRGTANFNRCVQDEFAARRPG